MDELGAVEMVTIYRGKDSVTYLASEFEELGEKATPYRINQNPSDSAPFVKIKLEDADAMMMHQELAPPTNKQTKERQT